MSYRQCNRYVERAEFGSVVLMGPLTFMEAQENFGAHPGPVFSWGHEKYRGTHYQLLLIHQKQDKCESFMMFNVTKIKSVQNRGFFAAGGGQEPT